MINYKKGKKKYKIDKLGSLYIKEKGDIDIPTIYIGDQIEHRSHVLEQTGLSFDEGHNLFVGSWSYNYPVIGKNKSLYNAENFSQSLIALIKEAGIKRANFITEGFGGIIGAYASKSELVEKVVAIHPPILGTPLASKELIKCKNLLTEKQKRIALLLSILVNNAYGFQQDNSQLIDLRKVDLNKFLVVGNTLDRKLDNSVLKDTYDIILNLNGYESDGVVPYDIVSFEHFGIQYLTEEKKQNHIEARSKENIEEAYRLTLK